MAVPEQDDTITPEDYAGKWAWLDGPAPFDGDVAVLEELCFALAERPQAVLACGEWRCLLQRKESPTPAGLLRHYELGFFVRARAPRAGESLTAPAPLVTSASFLADGSDTARRAAQSAVAVLLRRAAATLDCEAPAPVAMRPQGAVANEGLATVRGRRRLVPVLVAAAIVVACLFGVRAFVLGPYLVPPSSEASPLQHSRRVLVDRAVYHLRPVGRGNLIVVRDPDVRNELEIRRVVALPDDLIVLRAGRLLVDGAAIARDQAQGGAATRVAPFDSWRLAAGSYGVAVLHDGAATSLEIVPRRAIVGELLLTFWPPPHLPF